MRKIVFSYRRQDSKAITGRIADQFVLRYGKKRVFLDIDSTPLGVDFRDHFDSILENTEVLIAIVGPKWRGPRRNKPPRIEDKNDRVRIEVEAALARKIRVVPVLVEDAPVLSEADLPASLVKFPYLNAMRIDAGRDFHTHMDRLFRDVEAHHTIQPPNATGGEHAAQDTQRSGDLWALSKRGEGIDLERIKPALPGAISEPVVLPPAKVVAPQAADASTRSATLLLQNIEGTSPPAGPVMRETALPPRRQYEAPPETTAKPDTNRTDATDRHPLSPPPADTAIIIATSVPHSYDHEEPRTVGTVAGAASLQVVAAATSADAEQRSPMGPGLERDTETGAASAQEQRGGPAERAPWIAALLAHAAKLAASAAARFGGHSQNWSLSARLKSVPRMKAIPATVGAVLLSLVAVCVGSEMASDANWARAIQVRLAQADASTSAMTADLQSLKKYLERDVSSYFSASLRHTISRRFVWSLDDAKVAHDRTLVALDRRLFDQIAAAARAHPRSFLEAANRRALGDSIKDYLKTVPGDEARVRVQDIQRRLVDLEQEVELVKVDFRPASAGARGVTNARAYTFVLWAGSRLVAEAYQANSTLNGPAQAFPILATSHVPRVRSVSVSLLTKTDFQLCYNEQPVSNIRNCVPAPAPWTQAVRDGELAVGPAGPVLANVTVKWTPVSPNIPQY